MEVHENSPPEDSPPPDDGAQWKRDLLAACAEAIAGLPDEVPHPSPSSAGLETPTLYSFFEEIAVLRNEVRKGNRRTAETFSKFGDVLETMREDSSKTRERLARPPDADAGRIPPRKTALGLVDLLDRADRLETAARTRASQGWLTRIRSGDGWVQQAEALSILHDHLLQLLSETGVDHINATPGTAFDPHLMKAVEREAAPHPNDARLVVAEELLPGYRLGEQCLRPAEVRVRPTNSPQNHE